MFIKQLNFIPKRNVTADQQHHGIGLTSKYMDVQCKCGKVICSVIRFQFPLI